MSWFYLYTGAIIAGLTGTYFYIKKNSNIFNQVNNKANLTDLIVHNTLSIINIYETSKDNLINIKNNILNKYFKLFTNKFKVIRIELIIDINNKYLNIDITDIFEQKKLNTLNKLNLEAIVETYGNILNSHGYDYDEININNVRLRMIYNYYNEFEYIYTWSVLFENFDYNRLYFFMDYEDPIKYIENKKEAEFYPELVYLVDTRKSENDKYEEITSTYLKYLGPEINSYNNNVKVEWFLKDELLIKHNEISHHEIHFIPRSHKLKTILIKKCEIQFELKLQDNIVPTL